MSVNSSIGCKKPYPVSEKETENCFLDFMPSLRAAVRKSPGGVQNEKIVNPQTLSEYRSSKTLFQEKYLSV